MGRKPCCSSEGGVNKGAWTAEEDEILCKYVHAHGEGKWRKLPLKAGLKRCGKSCRLRWFNYLRPNIKRGNISPDEEDLIIRLHKLLGNRWSLIAGRLPGRTDNEIKNYWNSNLGKRVDQRKTQSQSISKIIFSPSSSPMNSNKAYSNVVRTKASKYSKKLSSMQLQTKTRTEREPELEPESLVVDDSANNIPTTSHKMETNGYDHKEKEPSFDNKLLDFDLEDICLPDLLNSDFSSFYNNFGGHNNEEYLVPFGEQPLVSSSYGYSNAQDLLYETSLAYNNLYEENVNGWFGATNSMLFLPQ